MERFETVFMLDAAGYKVITRHFYSPGWKVFMVIITPLLIVTGVAGIVHQIPIFILGGFGLAFFYLIRLFWEPRNYVRQSIKITRENTGGTVQEIQSSFAENNMCLLNLTTNSTATISYNNVKHFFETEEHYFLKTKSRQLIVVNKATLAQSGETDAFLQFIKSKLPHVKIK